MISEWLAVALMAFCWAAGFLTAGSIYMEDRSPFWNGFAYVWLGRFWKDLFR